MSSLVRNLPAIVVIARGDLLQILSDPAVSPDDKTAAIEFFFANLPNLDAPVVFKSEVDAVAFLQVLANAGGVVLNVDTVNELVGVGTAAPDGKVHIFSGSSGATVNAGADDLIIESNLAAGLSILTPNTTFGQILFGDPESGNVGILRYNHSTNVFFIATNGATRFQIDALGNIGIGSTAAPSAGGGKVLYFGDNAGDPTMASNTAGFYGKDVAGTVEAIAIDEDGNAVQLTSHPADAPSAFYLSVDIDELPAFICKSFNTYIGKIHWYRSDIGLRQYETFAAYNTRHGLIEGDAGSMVVCDWTECQQAQVDRSEAEHAAWQAARDAAADAEEPFDKPEPEIYTAKDPPQSLQDRGITLKIGS